MIAEKHENDVNTNFNLPSVMQNRCVACAMHINAPIGHKKLHLAAKYIRYLLSKPGSKSAKLSFVLSMIKMHAEEKKAFKLIWAVVTSALSNLKISLTHKGLEFDADNYTLDIQTSGGNKKNRSYLPRVKGSADTIVKGSSHIKIKVMEVTNGKKN